MIQKQLGSSSGKALSNEQTLERLFETFDFDKSGSIDFKECMILLSVLGSSGDDARERFQLIFNLYDRDGSGSLESPEVFGMARSLLRVVVCVRRAVRRAEGGVRRRFMI